MFLNVVQLMTKLRKWRSLLRLKLELRDSWTLVLSRFLDFIHPQQYLPKSSDTSNLQIPLIDRQGFEGCRRTEIVNKIGEASETWGFFQVINHTVPVSVMEKMIEGVRGFHEVKMEMYSRDTKNLVRYFCNGDLLVTKAAANWRDSIAFDFLDGQLEPQLFPEICRCIYIKSVGKNTN